MLNISCVYLYSKDDMFILYHTHLFLRFQRLHQRITICTTCSLVHLANALLRTSKAVSSCSSCIAVLIPVSVQTERAYGHSNSTWLVFSILFKHNWHQTSICTLFSAKVVAVGRHARPTHHKKSITLLGNLSDHTFFQYYLYGILCSPCSCW